MDIGNMFKALTRRARRNRALWGKNMGLIGIFALSFIMLIGVIKQLE